MKEMIMPGTYQKLDMEDMRDVEGGGGYIQSFSYKSNVAYTTFLFRKKYRLH